MTSTIDLVATEAVKTQSVRILRPKYAISQLFLSTKKDQKSHDVLGRLVLQTIPNCCGAETLEMYAHQYEPGDPFEEIEGFEFASLETSLSFMAHLADDPRKLAEAFCDDPRPMICLEHFLIPSSRTRGKISPKYLIMGVDIEPKKPLPQVRLLSACNITKVCGGYYRPIVTLKPNEESSDEFFDEEE